MIIEDLVQRDSSPYEGVEVVCRGGRACLLVPRQQADAIKKRLSDQGHPSTTFADARQELWLIEPWHDISPKMLRALLKGTEPP